jgi:hypothetical protein
MRRAALALVLALAACDSRKPPPPPPPAPSFDQDRALRDLYELCGIGSRNHGSTEKSRAEAWIQSILRDCGAEVSIHEFTHTAKDATAPSHFRNIVGRFRAAEKKRVLLGSHYDTRSWADEDPNVVQRDFPVNGANDGGSGVAVLLELARVFKAAPPPCGVDLVFFDGEDFGRKGVWEDYFLGSRAWVRERLEPRPEWGVILDMVGDKDLAIPRDRHSLEAAPAVTKRVWEAAKRAGASAFTDGLQGPVTDDHTAFLQKAVPVILVIDFTYPYWHTEEDTPDKCSAESLGQVGRTLLEAFRQE